MKKIFIIKASGGSYDDAWENNLYAVEDQTQAELDVLQLKQDHDVCKDVWMNVWAVLQEGYVKVRGAAAQFKLPKEPKGPVRPNKESTAEYRRAYAEWRKQCEPIWAEIRKKQDAEMQAAIAIAFNYAAGRGLTRKQLEMLGFFNAAGELTSPSFQADTSYHFEELELR